MRGGVRRFLKKRRVSSANRAISTGQLRGLLRFHLRPIDVVVFHGSRRDLVLRRVSRLDAMSRHRGAKRRRRYGLLGVISLLSPAYLLSVERWPFHTGPPDHYGRLSSLLELSLSQSGGLVPLHSAADFRPA